jgi:hypothetical protein
MAKKRVEEADVQDLENITIDDSIENIPMTEMPLKKNVTKTETKVSAAPTTSTGVVNCLRNEKVIVRFVPRPTAMVQNPKHILFGGMADTATRSFVVPRLSSTGMFKNVLTDSEKAFLEQAMGLEYNALSVYRKQDNFWDDSNPMGIGRVTLHKQDNYLDLSNPEDYIKYKILLANKDTIASSMQELEDRPKATYQFVIISENAEANMINNKADIIMQCYEEFGSIRDDADTLRAVIELLEGRPLSAKVKLDYLKSKVTEYIQAKPKMFLAVVKDELLPIKVLIKKSLEAGLIGKKNDTYYLRQDGSPLCEMGEESTLNNAARYLASVKHQDLKFLLEAKVKEG